MALKLLKFEVEIRCLYSFSDLLSSGDFLGLFCKHVASKDIPVYQTLPSRAFHTGVSNYDTS